MVSLLVLVHGLWGTVAHFDYICEQLSSAGAHIINDLDPQQLSSDEDDNKTRLFVYRTRSNQGYFTYDGIDVCGTRVANEVTSVLELIEKVHGPVVDDISVMGYSLGGLVSRYALGVLYKQGIFDRIKPRVFTTFCTPHVGVVVLGNRLSTQAFNSLGSRCMASTSLQLFLKDKHKGGKPLLELMSEPGSSFVQALNLFEEKCLYANVAYDARCEWYTAGISSTDPYHGRAHLLRGPYIEGYKPTIFDISDAPRFETLEVTTTTTTASGKRRKRTVMEALGFYAVAAFKIVLVIPVWFIAFLVNATYQNVTSSIRQMRFRRAITRDEATSSIMDELLEEGADDVVESMYRAITENDNQEGEEAKLQLSALQSKIIASLNLVNWDKYPVIITKHHHAHAAVIVRYGNANFDEGKAIVRHWIESKLETLLE